MATGAIKSNRAGKGGGWREAVARTLRRIGAAIVLLTAYVALVLTTLGVAGTQWLGWAMPTPGEAIRTLFLVNAVVLLWRLGMRGYCTARWYGPRQALQALPRAFLGNVIAILAARRAASL